MRALWLCGFAMGMKVILFANTDWYLYNFRRSLALALQTAGHDVLMISPAGGYGRKLQELGLRWQALPMDRRSLNPLREAILLHHLVKMFRQEHPDVVHSFTVKCAVYGSVAARMAGVPARINAVAGMGYVFASRRLKARLLRPVVSGLLRLGLGGVTSRLILQNPDDEREFVDARLVDPGKVRLIRGSGVDLTKFSPVKEKSSGQIHGVPIVLMAARLLWDKGVAEYVDAARQLRKRGVAVKMLLAGSPDDGNPASVSRTEIDEWVEEGLVDWLGHVDDMASLLAGVDIFVLPSFYREGTPRSLIEAAGCAKALVTTDMPGCREVVSDGETGLLVPPRDATALAVAIEKLASDPVLARQLGQAARVKALAEFDERIVIERTMAVYEELLGESFQAQLQSL